jgi:hypothetical protein
VWVESINDDGMPWLINLATMQDLYVRVADFAIVCELISLVDEGKCTYYVLFQAKDEDIMKKMAIVQEKYQKIKNLETIRL